MTMYPNKRVQIIGHEEYDVLKAEYKTQISVWE